jgi:hypothetical protein
LLVEASQKQFADKHIKSVVKTNTVVDLNHRTSN